MKFIDIAKQRYTTKEYDPSQRISSQEIEELKEILRLSPSSINSQPWKFVFVSDKKIKEELAEVSNINDQRTKDASHLVVFCVRNKVEDFEKFAKENLPDPSFQFYDMAVKSNGEIAVKSWLQHQVYLSLGFFLSACASMGIDSTPMEGIDPNAYDRILQIDGNHYQTLFAVAIGYRNPEDRNQPSKRSKSRRLLDDVIQSI